MDAVAVLIDLRGNLHPCYPPLKILSQCINSNHFPGIQCYLERSDYLECWHGHKQKQAARILSNQILAKKVLSIPRYNPETDSFEGETLTKI